jgi:hypothetical protein
MAMIAAPPASLALSTPGSLMCHVEVSDFMLTSDGTWVSIQMAPHTDNMMAELRNTEDVQSRSQLIQTAAAEPYMVAQRRGSGSLSCRNKLAVKASPISPLTMRIYDLFAYQIESVWLQSSISHTNNCSVNLMYMNRIYRFSCF